MKGAENHSLVPLNLFSWHHRPLRTVACVGCLLLRATTPTLYTQKPRR